MKIFISLRLSIQRFTGWITLLGELLRLALNKWWRCAILWAIAFISKPGASPIINQCVSHWLIRSPCSIHHFCVFKLSFLFFNLIRGLELTSLGFRIDTKPPLSLIPSTLTGSNKFKCISLEPARIDLNIRKNQKKCCHIRSVFI